MATILPTTQISVGLAILAGVITVLSPCILPILPIILGRSLQSHRLGPLMLVVGLVSGFAVAGSLLGVTASWLTNLSNSLRTAAIILLLGLGVVSFFPTWCDRLWQMLPFRYHPKEPNRIGLAGEFWLGTQLGLLWTPCAGPVLAGILVLAAAQQQAISALGLLSMFGIGAALPLLVIAYGSRSLSQKFLKIRPYSAVLQRMGGVMILGTAIAILLGWDVQLQLWLAPFFPRLPL
jgi:cytochrome c-type biogenesis protein